jgi:hypothetical protein
MKRTMASCLHASRNESPEPRLPRHQQWMMRLPLQRQRHPYFCQSCPSVMSTRMRCQSRKGGTRCPFRHPGARQKSPSVGQSDCPRKMRNFERHRSQLSGLRDMKAKASLHLRSTPRQKKHTSSLNGKTEHRLPLRAASKCRQMITVAPNSRFLLRTHLSYEGTKPCGKERPAKVNVGAV